MKVMPESNHNLEKAEAARDCWEMRHCSEDWMSLEERRSREVSSSSKRLSRFELSREGDGEGMDLRQYTRKELTGFDDVQYTVYEMLI